MSALAVAAIDKEASRGLIIRLNSTAELVGLFDSSYLKRDEVREGVLLR